jgi:hypothetical protein
MILALGLIACAYLWWISKKHGSLRAAFDALPRHWLAGWAAIVAAGGMLLHGNLIVAAILGIGGLWTLEGPDKIGKRLRVLLPRFTPTVRLRRSRLIELAILPDGSVGEGRIRSGPMAGTLLGSLDGPALLALLARCRAEDPEGAVLLEAYLDRRAPGWRVDAEADRDPRAGGPAKPGTMAQEEAYQILGLERGAPAEEIRSAHRALMKRAHPDQGGSAEAAARLNAARDRLLNRHR